MANEFIIRKGYKSLYSSEITGSLDVSVSVHATDVFVSGHGSVSASLSSIVANDLDGSGTANYISKFSDTDTLTDSSISDDGSTINLFANTTGNTGVVNIYGEGGVPPTLQVSSRTNRAKLKIADNDTAINIIAEGSIGSFGFGSTSSATNNISILSTGRVGIGVIASTNAMLDVRGPDTDNAVLGRFWSNTGARGSFIIRNGSGVNPTTFIGTAGGSEQLSIGTNNTEAIRIDASQKVGIGITNPLHPLHVVGIISGSDTYINGWNSVSGSLYNITTTHTDFSASVSTRFEGLTTDYTELDNIPNDIVSSSIQVDHDQTTNFVAGEHFLQSAITTVGTVTTGNINAILPTNTVSSSAQIASDISGSITSFSGSIAGRVETNETNITALNGATGSYLLNTTDTLTGNLTVTGTLTAQEFHTEFVSASILFDSGSTKFGDSSDDVHSFTGSLQISGSGITIKDPGTPVINLIDETNDLSLKFRSANNYGYIDLDAGNSVGSSRLLLRTDGYPFLYGNQNHDVYIPSGSLIIGTETLTGKFNSYISATRQLTHNGNGGDLSIISDNNSAPVLFVKGTGTADLVNIYDNTTEVFTILDGGNVGIGTTSPSAKLHLYVNSANDDTFHIFNGSVRTHLLGSESSNGVIYMRSSANSNTVRINASGDSYFNGGNVGIGTTSPLSKFQVNGQASVLGNSFNGLAYFNGTNALASYNTANKIVMSSNGSADGLYTGGLHLTRRALTQQGHFGSGIRGISVGTVLQDNALELYTSTNTEQNATRLKITSTGNVGIGTTSPGTELEIGDGTGSPGLTLNKATTGTASLFFDNAGNNKNWIKADAAESLIFGTNNSTNVTIKEGGNVGIGTTNPQVRLTLRREDNGSLFEFNRPASGVEALYGGIVGNDPYFYSNNGIFTLGINNPDGGLGGEVPYITMRNGATRYTTFEAGNVGIGTTSPSAKLEVNGVTLVRGGSFSTPNDTRGTVGLIIAEDDFIYTLDGSNGDYLRKLIGKTSDVITIGESGTSLIDGINLLPGTTGGYVQVYNNASVAAKFVDGKLGIGTTSPTIKFEVVGDGTGNSGIGFKQSGAQEHRLYAANQTQHNAIGSSAPIWKWGQSDATGSISSQRMLLNNSGLTVTGDIDSDDITIDGWGSVSSSLASIATAGGVNGSGTTNDLVMWSGANSISDAPIAISGNNATFAGNVTASNLSGTNTGDQDLSGYAQGDLSDYLPLTAGSTKPLTDTLYGTKATFGDTNIDVATVTIEGGLAGILDIWRNGTNASYQAIRFRDDTNANTEASIGWSSNQLRLNGTSTIVATTGGSERMRIDSSGNVGIGTTSPSAELEVNVGLNSLKISGRDTYIDSSIDSTNANIYVTQDGVGDFSQLAGSLVLQARTHGTVYRDIIFAGGITNGDALMTILGEGRVGIGTTSPGAKLTIKGSDSLNAFKITDSGDGDGFKVTSHTTQGTYVQAYDASHTQTIMLDARSDSTNRHTYFNGGGNVGIGTTSPVTKTHIQHTVRINDAYGLFLVENTNTTATSALTNAGINVKNREGTSQFMQWEEHGLRIGSRIITNDGVGDVIFTAGADSEKMRIEAGGNVGIGTTSPSKTLHVVSAAEAALFQGTATWGTAIQIDSTATGGRNFQIQSSADAAGEGGGKFLIVDRDATGAPTRLSIDSTGNVGIGTTSPGKKLEVVGTIRSNTNGNRVAGNINIGLTTNNTTKWSSITSTQYAHDTETEGFSIINGLGTSALNAVYIGGALNEQNAATEIGFYTAANTTTRTGSIKMKIDSSGNVGIGTTSPSVPLEVHGADITTRANTTAQSVLRLVRDVTDSSYTSTKDSAVDFMLSRQQTVNNNLPYTRLDIRLAGTTDSSTPSLDVMSLLHNGNVGIGTTSPIGNLNINGGTGDAVAQDSVLNLTRTSSTGNVYSAKLKLVEGASTTHGDLRFQVKTTASSAEDPTYYTDAITIKGNTGNVGIGATDPLRKLHVVGNMAINAGTDEYYGILMQGGESANPSILIGDWHNSSGTIKWDSSGNYLRIDSQHSTANAAIIFSGNDATTEYMRIASTGNVGIGTSNVTEKLVVDGNVKVKGNIIGVEAGTIIKDVITDQSYEGAAFYNPETLNAFAGADKWATISVTNAKESNRTSALTSLGAAPFNVLGNTIQVYFDTSETEIVIEIDHTTNPLRYHGVVGIQFTAGAWIAARVKFEGYNGTAWTTGLDTTTNTDTTVSSKIALSAAGIQKTRITLGDPNNSSSGYMRISKIFGYDYKGVSSANDYQSGTYYISRYENSAHYSNVYPATDNTYSLGTSGLKYANIYAGVLTATSIVETSAKRFKENIKSLESQTDKLQKLKPVSFDWKENSKADVGFIAEEVKEIYPELVSEENGETQGIQYSKLTAILVKAVQDQQKQIDELKEEIFILKKK